MLACRHVFGGGLGLASFCAWVFVWYFSQTSVYEIGVAGCSILFWLCLVARLVAGWWQGGGGYFLKKWHRGELLVHDLQKIFFQFRMARSSGGVGRIANGGIIDRRARGVKM